jgi:hypothetical protein
MIDTTETLRWALLVFTVLTGADGEQSSTHSAPSFYASIGDCAAEGQRILSVIEPAPGVLVRFACIPRTVLRDDLAMRPRPHH